MPNMRCTACCMQHHFALDAILMPGLGCLRYVTWWYTNQTSKKKVTFSSNSVLMFLPSCLKVLRILEGDMIMDSSYTLSPGYANGNKSGRMWPEQQQQQQQHSSPIRKQASEVLAGKKSYEALRTAWERERESIMRRCWCRKKNIYAYRFPCALCILLVSSFLLFFLLLHIFHQSIAVTLLGCNLYVSALN